MTATPIHHAQLSPMEEARRQTQRQLDLIDRQVLRRITSVLPQLARRQTGYRRGSSRMAKSKPSVETVIATVEPEASSGSDDDV